MPTKRIKFTLILSTQFTFNLIFCKCKASIISLQRYNSLSFTIYYHNFIIIPLRETTKFDERQENNPWKHIQWNYLIKTRPFKFKCKHQKKAIDTWSGAGNVLESVSRPGIVRFMDSLVKMRHPSKFYRKEVNVTINHNLMVGG